jgi:hypothetical protein
MSRIDNALHYYALEYPDSAIVLLDSFGQAAGHVPSGWTAGGNVVLVYGTTDGTPVRVKVTTSDDIDESTRRTIELIVERAELRRKAVETKRKIEQLQAETDELKQRINVNMNTVAHLRARL